MEKRIVMSLLFVLGGVGFYQSITAGGATSASSSAASAAQVNLINQLNGMFPTASDIATLTVTWNGIVNAWNTYQKSGSNTDLQTLGNLIYNIGLLDPASNNPQSGLAWNSQFLVNFSDIFVSQPTPSYLQFLPVLDINFVAQAGLFLSAFNQVWNAVSCLQQRSKQKANDAWASAQEYWNTATIPGYIPAPVWENLKQAWSKISFKDASSFKSSFEAVKLELVNIYEAYPFMEAENSGLSYDSSTNMIALINARGSELQNATIQAVNALTKLYSEDMSGAQSLWKSAQDYYTKGMKNLASQVRVDGA